MTEQRKQTRNGGSVLSLKELAPSGWREEKPAFAGDEFFDWESTPEPPRTEREPRIPELRRKHR